MGKIAHKKVEVDGHLFDSKTEAEYYLYLKNNKENLGIDEIGLQPKFVLLDEFVVPCSTCQGEGLVPSPKTGKPIKCKRCKDGFKSRRGWTYKADFQVFYNDGRHEVVDVKGYANERFPLVKKMFEYRRDMELIVVKKVKGEWVRK